MNRVAPIFSGVAAYLDFTFAILKRPTQAAFIAKRVLLHGVHISPASATLHFNLATMLRATSIESSSPTATVVAKRQLAAGLQLDHTHMFSRVAIAADEYDEGNTLGSEVHLIETLHILRSVRLRIQPSCELSSRSLMSQTSSVRILILTNIAVLHQRRGEHKSAEARYKQIRDLGPHLLGNYVHLLVHACWCEATNTLASLLVNKAKFRDTSPDLDGRVLQWTLEVLKEQTVS